MRKLEERYSNSKVSRVLRKTQPFVAQLTS